MKDFNGEGLPGTTRGSHIIALETHSGFATTVFPDIECQRETDMALQEEIDPYEKAGLQA